MRSHRASISGCEHAMSDALNVLVYCRPTIQVRRLPAHASPEKKTCTITGYCRSGLRANQSTCFFLSEVASKTAIGNRKMSMHWQRQDAERHERMPWCDMYLKAGPMDAPASTAKMTDTQARMNDFHRSKQDFFPEVALVDSVSISSAAIVVTSARPSGPKSRSKSFSSKDMLTSSSPSFSSQSLTRAYLCRSADMSDGWTLPFRNPATRCGGQAQRSQHVAGSWWDQ